MKNKFRQKLSLALAIFFLLVLSFSYVGASNMKRELASKLLATLHQFTKDNAISGEQLSNLVGELVLNGQNFKKGGVGVVDAQIFIVVDEKKNALVIAGDRWEGKSAQESEVVIIEGNRIATSLEGKDLSLIKIILFSPKEVRFINLYSNTGGKYLRGI